MNIFSWLRIKAIPWFTALGLTSGTITLEVAGRKSGRPVGGLHPPVGRVRPGGCKPPTSGWRQASVCATAAPTRGCTRLIASQARTMNTALNRNVTRGWLPAASTSRPATVGPRTAAAWEER